MADTRQTSNIFTDDGLQASEAERAELTRSDRDGMFSSRNYSEGLRPNARTEEGRKKDEQFFLQLISTDVFTAERECDLADVEALKEYVDEMVSIWNARDADLMRMSEENIVLRTNIEAAHAQQGIDATRLEQILRNSPKQAGNIAELRAAFEVSHDHYEEVTVLMVVVAEEMAKIAVFSEEEEGVSAKQAYLEARQVNLQVLQEKVGTLTDTQADELDQIKAEVEILAQKVIEIKQVKAEVELAIAEKQQELEAVNESQAVAAQEMEELKGRLSPELLAIVERNQAANETISNARVKIGGNIVKIDGFNGLSKSEQHELQSAIDFQQSKSEKLLNINPEDLKTLQSIKALEAVQDRLDSHEDKINVETLEIKGAFQAAVNQESDIREQATVLTERAEILGFDVTEELAALSAFVDDISGYAEETLNDIGNWFSSFSWGDDEPEAVADISLSGKFRNANAAQTEMEEALEEDQMPKSVPSSPNILDMDR